ncbi:MAG: exodeoxyribonuclease VII large subunit [Gammaproteobacteria bacterium HGW-Gammaproteobacteria-3]|nr:MAG: exodeoxyribonuclease VII large subunit [Gammaproteobacteria bacterium HGW-Gammaproteobacteria-3]
MLTATSTSLPEARIYTVSELNQASNRLLNEHFLRIQVEGEISNLSTPSSGHVYFTLKDAAAQIRCALFRSQSRRLSFKPENGLKVIARAQVTLYEPRGDYQLLVESLEPAGDGALLKAFEALKLKLAQQGLFDAAHKKPIPALPDCIGVITSPSGAALRDMLTVLRRRFPAIPVILYPVAVQGESAKYEIAKALDTANTLNQCDVLILGRGGGALEDLWAFNEEIVARALYASSIPVITGIGHETDFSIADFVADLRAPTPSAAAEHAVPDQREWLHRLRRLENQIKQQWQQSQGLKSQTLQWLTKRLQQQHPGQKLMRNAQRLDELESRLARAVQHRLRHARSTLAGQTAKFRQHSPMPRINALSVRQQHLQGRLLAALSHKIERLDRQLLQASQTLHAVSPLATLGRGYALVTEAQSGVVIRSTEQLSKGDLVHTRLAHGHFNSRIETLDTRTAKNRCYPT